MTIIDKTMTPESWSIEDVARGLFATEAARVALIAFFDVTAEIEQRIEMRPDCAENFQPASLSMGSVTTHLYAWVHEDHPLTREATLADEMNACVTLGKALLTEDDRSRLRRGIPSAIEAST
jgi:hypothetical protein